MLQQARLLSSFLEFPDWKISELGPPVIEKAGSAPDSRLLHTRSKVYGSLVCFAQFLKKKVFSPSNVLTSFNK